MAFEPVYQYFKQKGLDNRITLFERATQNVAEAATWLNTSLGSIAKSIVFDLDHRLIMVVCSSDEKINMRKFVAHFGKEAPLLADQKVPELVGHVVGGVCPFNLPANIEVYLDMSLRRFDFVYPAAGSRNSAIQLTPDELEIHSLAKSWVYLTEGDDQFGRHSFHIEDYM